MIRTVLTDGIWERIQPLLPSESGYWGRPSKSHRVVLEGILWILRLATPWREIPSDYDPWSSCYNRFNRWTAKEVWRELWDALKDEIDHENYSIDGSNVKAHQNACRAKKKRERVFRNLERGNHNKNSRSNRWTWAVHKIRFDSRSSA